MLEPHGCDDVVLLGHGGQAVPQPSKACKHTLNCKHMITLNYFSGIIHTLKSNALLDLGQSLSLQKLPKCRGAVRVRHPYVFAALYTAPQGDLKNLPFNIIWKPQLLSSAEMGVSSRTVFIIKAR